MCVWEEKISKRIKDRPLDLIRGKALVGNVFETQSNCPYFSSNPYIFTDMNTGTVRPVLAPIIKAVWRPRAVQIPPGEYMVTLSHSCHLTKYMED